MSMRLQARLKEKLSSHSEEAYLRRQDLVVLENVDAEMTFKTTQAFMEHESEAHGYLPCFHMMGEITEVRGNFPFNVSALYFDAMDSSRLQKDIIYYPSPQELSHMIEVGKFYTKRFTIPPILSDNTYTLPCKISLMIVPPPNLAAYETAVLQNFADLEEEEKVNLPLFYIGLLGTGVSRKTDRLLDYYGIDIEPGYEQFVLTAESSGYTDPPLLQYMPEPESEAEDEQSRHQEYYISAEEEAEMLHSANERQQAAEREASQQVVMDAQADFRQATQEDAIIADADRSITRRMEDVFGGRRMSLAAKRELDHTRQQEKQPDMPQQQADIKMDLNTEGNAYVQQDREEKKAAQQTAEDIIHQDRQQTAQMEGADVQDQEVQTKVDEAHAADLARDAAVQQQQESLRESQRQAAEQAGKKRPETPQQKADVKMDLNPERNDDVRKEREDAEKQQAPEDRTDLENKAGADVSDARAQSKIDEAHARDIARDAAVERQQREVPDSMQEMADKYEKGKQDSGKSAADDEYI